METLPTDTLMDFISTGLSTYPLDDLNYPYLFNLNRAEMDSWLSTNAYPFEEDSLLYNC